MRRGEASRATACPCGGTRPYAGCCGRYLDGGEPAPDAEALMRSRYSAYVLGREDYLLATWHPRARPARLDLDAEPKPKWLGLKVLGHCQADAGHATVRFEARYRLGGRAFRMGETSRFERIDGRWYYLEGEGSEP